MRRGGGCVCGELGCRCCRTVAAERGLPWSCRAVVGSMRQLDTGALDANSGLGPHMPKQGKMKALKVLQCLPCYTTLHDVYTACGSPGQRPSQDACTYPRYLRMCVSCILVLYLPRSPLPAAWPARCSAALAATSWRWTAAAGSCRCCCGWPWTTRGIRVRRGHKEGCRPKCRHRRGPSAGATAAGRRVAAAAAVTVVEGSTSSLRCGRSARGRVTATWGGTTGEEGRLWVLGKA